MTLRFFLTPAMALMAAPAIADISTDDVWDNTVAFYAATGGVLTANRDRDGANVFVDDIVLTYTTPFDFGEATIAMPPMTLVEEDDGTVTQMLPKAFEVIVTFESDALYIEKMQLIASITQDGFEATAAGTPGDITYSRGADGYTATVTFGMSELEFSDFDMDFNFIGEGYTTVTRVTEEELITVSVDSTVQAMTMNYEVNDDFGFRTTGSGNYGVTRTVTQYALPAGGTDLLNLAPALRSGMFLEGRTTTDRMADQTVTYIDGDIFTQDSTRSGPSESFVRFSADGFEMSGSALDIGFTYEENEFTQISVAGDIARVSGEFLMPILSSDSPQDVGLAMSLEEITLSDSTWNLFDPDGAIPRNPMLVALDLVGSMTTSVDLVDFAGLETAFIRGGMPITIETATINALSVEGAGATANGSGQFTFDNTDLDTFDGMPRPEGRAAIDITGANALLDTLVAAGLVPESEAGMGRMMLGMFTRATGDDEASSTLEINADGHILVNGERVR